MRESDIVKAIMKYLKTVPGCFCWKEHGGMYGTAGIPDIIACILLHLCSSFFHYLTLNQVGPRSEPQTETGGTI